MMGYRSDVTYAVQAPEKIMISTLAAWRLTGKHEQALAECAIGTCEGIGFITFFADSVK